jgi:hypothetical protein
MDRTVYKHVKQNKPGSGGQSSHVLSYMLNLDLKYMQRHTYIYSKPWL